MTEVEVRNFQSIEHATIRIEGFTAIVGRSNIGKSALVRAVKAALTGATGTAFVRHGDLCARRTKDSKTCKCQASVRIQREGFDLLWEKGDAVNRYVFNGTVYDSVERGTPSFLQEGYALIKVGDSKELLQVCDQFDPIYLLNQTGGVIADVLSDVAHLDRMNVAMRLVEKDRKEATSTRKVREQDITTLTGQVVLYDGLDDAVSRVKTAEAGLAGVERAGGHLTRVERFLEACSARATEIRTLAGIEAIVEPPAVGPLRDRAGAFQRLAGWWDDLVGHRSWFERMKGLDALLVPDKSPLGTAEQGWLQISKLAGRIQSLSHEVDRIEADHGRILEEVKGIQDEWDALGVCPTCAQPCRGVHAEAV
jgi:hypothetical protein